MLDFSITGITQLESPYHGNKREVIRKYTLQGTWGRHIGLTYSVCLPFLSSDCISASYVDIDYSSGDIRIFAISLKIGNGLYR